MKNKKTYVLIALFLSVLMACYQDNTPLENEQETPLETLDLLEVENFFSSKKKTLASKVKNKLNLVPHLDQLVRDSIKNSNALLTVIPTSTKYKNVKSSILLLKINGKTESILFSKIPLKDANTPNFTGDLIFTQLDGKLLSVYKIKNGIIDKAYRNKKFLNAARKTTAAKTSTDDCDEDYATGEFCDNELDEVVIVANSQSNYMPISYIYIPSSPSYSYEPVDNSIGWSFGGGGSSGGSSGTNTGTNTTEDVPPSCESFNFQQTAGLWQESAVKNIRFHVYLLSQNGIKYKFTCSFPQPVLFGTPTNLTNGGNLSSGVAATTSAQVMQKVMSETARKYANSYVSESSIESYFKERLKTEYPKYIPGGRVNFNANSFSVIPTEYKTNTFGTGNCK